MALITQNINYSKLNPLNETAISNKNISFSAAKTDLTTASIIDTVEFNKKISFKGSKIAGIKKFFTGEAPVPVKSLLDDITGYITPSLDNPFVHSLAYDVNHSQNGIIKEEIRTVEPFLKNVIKAFTDLPRLIIRTAKKIFGSEEIKKEVEREIKQSEARSTLLGLWMNVTKVAGDFDKRITGKNHAELKNILKDGVTGKEEELSNFFKERKLQSVYSYKDGKASGILCKDNNLETFVQEILSTAPKSGEESFIKKIKKEYVQEIIDDKMISKQGAFLSSAGQSATSFMARVISGTIPAWFIAHDFYNLKMAHSDDKEQADAEWQSKFKQESSRIGIDAYQGYILSSVFEKLTNKSLAFAVGINIINTAGANIFSRKITGRPVLPIDINDTSKIQHADLEKNTPVDEKIKQLAVYKTFKGIKPVIGFGTNNSGVIHAVKDYFTMLDRRFAQEYPAVMDIEQFTKDYKKVKAFDRKDAKKMLQIAAVRINETAGKDNEVDLENLSLADILSHANAQGKIIIGRNRIYRYSKEILNIIKFPFRFSAIVGRALINPVLKLFGKKPLESPEKSSFYSEQFIKNVTKWADNVNTKMGIINDENREEAIGRYAKNKKNFFNTKVMEYGANELSTAMKFTGFVSVPFLATDAYNVTIGETKNKESAAKKRNERAIQDSSRQGVSLYISYAFNQMGKAISSASLLGNAVVIGLSAFCYESFTRLIVGQPLLPVTHEKMVEIEKEKAKNKNWFVKLMAGRLKTNDDASANSEAISAENPINNSSQPNVFEIYQKNKLIREIFK